MKKLIISLVSIVMLLVIGFTVFTSIVYKKEKDKEKAKEEIENTDKKLKDILNYDFENDYPDNYKDVLTAYVKTVEYIYSGKEDLELDKVIKVQRQLLAKEVLELNTLEEQTKQALIEINENKEANFSVYSSKIYDMREDNLNKNLVTASVRYYTTAGKGNNIDIEYNIFKVFGKWKVFDFRRISGLKNE